MLIGSLPYSTPKKLTCDELFIFIQVEKWLKCSLGIHLLFCSKYMYWQHFPSFPRCHKTENIDHLV